jgi:hypothetical protein
VLVIEANGKTIAQPIEIPLGDAKRPVPPAQVVEKYVRNAEEVVGTDVARQTARMLLEIETLSSIRPVLDSLAKRSVTESRMDYGMATSEVLAPIVDAAACQNLTAIASSLSAICILQQRCNQRGIFQ